MRLMDKQTELALNVMQLLYVGKSDKQSWATSALASQLQESALFIHQALKTLKAKGYVYTIGGRYQGGLALMPGVEERTLKEFLLDFDRLYMANPSFGSDYASTKANERLLYTAQTTPLKLLFTEVMGFPGPQGAA